MTILPPPRTECPHGCRTPAPLRRDSWGNDVPAHEDGTLWECPVCGRWWKCRALRVPDPRPYEVYYSGSPYTPAWCPVRWYDVPARRRIAAHETDKHATPAHWWDCHPNPKRGQP